MHDLDRAMFETGRIVGEEGSAEHREFLEVLGELLEGPGEPSRAGADPARIRDRTHLTSPSLRKGRARPPGQVHALVLHQMAFSRGNDPARYDTVNSHFAILPDGAILQLHPTSALLWASNGLNAGSVAVEFAGTSQTSEGDAGVRQPMDATG